MSPEESQERSRNRLARSLDLTDDQREPFFRTMQHYTTDLHQVIRNRRELEHEMIVDHYRGFRDEISAILNEEQLERLDSYLHPDSVRAKRGGPGGFRVGRN
jgi:Spy/CpxP family protein refolding chaperone